MSDEQPYVPERLPDDALDGVLQSVEVRPDVIGVIAAVVQALALVAIAVVLAVQL